MISTSGSGQMQPLPMNEFLQENLKQTCNVDVTFNVVEWQVLLNAGRARRGFSGPAGGERAQRLLALVRRRRDGALLLLRQRLPEGLQLPAMAGCRFDAAMGELAGATDPATVAAATRAARHERLVDDPPWLYIVHDLNPGRCRRG